MSDKMRQSLALNQAASSSSESDSESEGQYSDPPPGASMLVGAAAPPPGPAGEEDGRLYCLCQSPHDNVVSFELAHHRLAPQCYSNTYNRCRAK